MVSLANHLASLGVRVDVVCVRRRLHWRTTPTHESIRVHAVKSLFFYYDAPHYTKLQRVRKAILRIPFVVLKPFVIDGSETALWRVRRTVLRLVRRVRPDTVIVSSPPHSWQSITASLRGRSSATVRIVSDYRDPWLDRVSYQPRGAFAMYRARLAERRSFRMPHRITTVTTGLAAVFRAKYNNSNIYVVENGYSDLPTLPTPDPTISALSASCSSIAAKTRLVIGYFGSGIVSSSDFVTGKNLFPLLSLLNSPPLEDKVVLVCQGSISWNAPRLQHLTNVLQLPTATQSQVRANMQAVDVGIVLYTPVGDEHVVMGGKVYEYAGAKIPMLVIAPRVEGALLEFHKQNPSSVLFASIDNEQEVRQALLDLWWEKERGLLKRRNWNPELSMRYSRENQNEKFCQILFDDSLQLQP